MTSTGIWGSGFRVQGSGFRVQDLSQDASTHRGGSGHGLVVCVRAFWGGGPGGEGGSLLLLLLEYS